MRNTMNHIITRLQFLSLLRLAEDSYLSSSLSYCSL